MQDRENQKALLDCFADHLKAETSLCFFYAKQVPFVEDTGAARILIGVGRVMHVTPAQEYRYTTNALKGKLRSMMWELMIQHSIRPGFKDGFIFPYHAALEKAATEPDFDPAEIAALLPVDRFSEFSYASELVTNDGAIGALLSGADALRKAKDHLRGAVGAAHEQPVQHGEEHGAFQRKAVLALARQRRDHRPAAGLLPQPLEHQRRPDAADPDLDRGLIAGRAQHHGLGRKARTRAHQPFQLAARLQVLETPERRDHLLTHLVAVAAALDDLQVGAPGRGLAAEVHAGSACWCAHRARFARQKATNIGEKRGTTLLRK